MHVAKKERQIRPLELEKHMGGGCERLLKNCQRGDCSLELWQLDLKS